MNIKLAFGVLCLAFCCASTAAPLPKDVQIDLVMGKITALVKAERYREALPHFAELEGMNTQLPESFYFYYVEALAQAGENEKAYALAEKYMTKYGRKGKYYAKVVSIASNLSIVLEKERKAQAEAAVVREQEAEKRRVASEAAIVLQRKVDAAWEDKHEVQTYVKTKPGDMSDGWIAEKCARIFRQLTYTSKSVKQTSCDCEITYHPAYDSFPKCRLDYRINAVIDRQ